MFSLSQKSFPHYISLLAGACQYGELTQLKRIKEILMGVVEKSPLIPLFQRGKVCAEYHQPFPFVKGDRAVNIISLSLL